MTKQSRPDTALGSEPVILSRTGVEASTPLAPRSITVSGNRDSTAIVSARSVRCGPQTSVPGCVSTLGGGLPCTGVDSVGSSSMNQVGDRLCSSLWRPAMPRGWQGQYFDEPVSYRLCSVPRGGMPCPVVGSVGSTSMNWSVTGCIAALGAGSEPRGRQIITSGSTVSSPNRPSLAISKRSSSSDRFPLIFRLFWSSRPHSSAPPPLPRKETPRSWAPNCSGEGGGGRSTTHFLSL